MRLFGLGGNSGENEATRQRREASLRSLEQGGLPLNAIDRLREQAGRQSTPEHLFSSDLSVNELALVREAGYEPLGQVMGSSVYHVGWQWQPLWTGSGEMTVLTQAFYEARHRALGRLQQEAMLLGATGVVAVRLECKQYDWGADLLEFAAIGTALREKDVPPPAAEVKPFLSDLSSNEFWVLRQSGYRPVGIAIGNCTYFQAGYTYMWNAEQREFTHALYTARSLAMERMEREARAVNAIGIVGADVAIEAERSGGDENQQTVNMIFHFTAIGTAIAPYTGRWPIFSVLNIVPLK